MCLRKLKILLADDSPNVREMIETALREKGYEVNAVSDGAEALAAATKADQVYDVVLLDYAMPQMDGLTAAMKMRVQEPEGKPEVKIGFFTGHGDLVVPPHVLEDLHARAWSKLNLVEMIQDLGEWVDPGQCDASAAACPA